MNTIKSITLGMAAAMVLAGGLAGFMPSATWAQSSDLTALNEEERAAFRDEVRAYLLENPEVLTEAIGVLEQRQAEAEAEAQAQAVIDNAGAIFNSAFDHVGGNPAGDVVIVEFIDYRCSFCRRAHPEVGELIESDGNIRLITKEFPILGEQSELASRFAIATRIALGGEAYELVNDALIAMRADVSELSLARLAGDLGLDSAAIFAAMEDPLVQATIDYNRALAGRMGITGTPSFVFGDQLVQGYVPLANMQEIVAILRETDEG